MTGKRYVFLGGLHRSGTSVLFRSIREHPAITGFENTDSPEDEGMHLQTVFLPSGSYGGAGRFGYHPDAHLTEQSPLVTDANRQKLIAEWEPYWDADKPYRLEKSPPNLIRTRFLQAMFPQSYFIILMRHPVAVTYATHAWYRQYRINWAGFRRILEHWLVCHEIFRDDCAHLERVLVVKYEHFVTQPQQILGQIYVMLGLDDVPYSEEIRPHVNEKYFARWHQRRNKAGLIRDFEDRFNAFGYSLIDLGEASIREDID